LQRARTEIEAWLHEHRHLTINTRKAHILPAGVPRTWLGYRLTRAGYDPGPKAL
jgi:hypothetical protein